jgi:hypothetical protein
MGSTSRHGPTPRTSAKKSDANLAVIPPHHQVGQVASKRARTTSQPESLAFPSRGSPFAEFRWFGVVGSTTRRHVGDEVEVP